MAEIGACEIGPVKVHAGEARAAEVRMAEISSARPRLAPLTTSPIGMWDLGRRRSSIGCPRLRRAASGTRTDLWRRC
jgi:hypothetical protein